MQRIKEEKEAETLKRKEFEKMTMEAVSELNNIYLFIICLTDHSENILVTFQNCQ